MLFSRQPEQKGTDIPDIQKKDRNKPATESVVVD